MNETQPAQKQDIDRIGVVLRQILRELVLIRQQAAGIIISTGKTALTPQDEPTTRAGMADWPNNLPPASSQSLADRLRETFQVTDAQAVLVSRSDVEGQKD